MHIKCHDCKGSKNIKGLGSFEKKCPTCKGIGYVDRDTHTTLEVMKANAPRRGRKPNKKSDNEAVL